MSKRKLLELVQKGLVSGWDDPRMPTLCGLRRRGYTPSSIFRFVKNAGIAKANSLVDIEALEHCIRDELNMNAPRRMCVLDPVKVTVTNYPRNQIEFFEVANNPNDPEAGTRRVPFTRKLYIERADFMENPVPKFFRLKPDGEVRLAGAYIVKCTGFVKNSDGSIKEIFCEADMETRNDMPKDGRKIKGTIHWVSESRNIKARVMQYDKLFTEANLMDLPEGKTYSDYLNPDSVKVFENALLEESLADAKPGDKFQFIRNGYYCKDTKNENTFNSVVGLRDTFKKEVGNA
jgi:glutaminyl-tRNA synthetase